jgi:hypothetical protein
MADWTVHAARLADELTESGKLWSAPWQAAIRAVPRHELVPVRYQRERGTDHWISTKGNVGFQTQEIALPQVRNVRESSYLRSP